MTTPKTTSKAIDDFFNMKKRYESKIKKNIIEDVCARLQNDHQISEDSIRSFRSEFFREYSRIKRQTNMENKKAKLINQRNTTTQNSHSNSKDAENIAQFSAYILKELKINLPASTSLSERTRICSKILAVSKNQLISLPEARKLVYDELSIFICNHVSLDVNKTDMYNMNDEREYDEYRGAIVYGWDDDGEALYEPTIGANINPPKYEDAGFHWKTVLEERWEQRSYREEGETKLTYQGN
jgi:hypothetical protein